MTPSKRGLRTVLLELRKTNVVSLRRIQETVRALQERSEVSGTLTAKTAIEHLQKAGDLRRISLKSSYGRNQRLWTTRPTSPLQLALASTPGSYLSHRSALLVHGLVRSASSVYVNKEQSEKDSTDEPLTQVAIDRAFGRPQRHSKYVLAGNGIRIVRLNGKYTGGLGVETRVDENGDSIAVTDVERTLIDVCVRPAYAGESPDILNAVRLASHRLNLETLGNYLTALDYRYPYHQTIGFLLERSGIERGRLAGLRARGKRLRFHVGYAMRDPILDPYWNVLYPLEMDRE